MRRFPTKEKALDACRYVGYLPGDLVSFTKDNWRVREFKETRPVYMVIAVSPGRFTDSAVGEEYIPVTAVVRLGSRVEFRSGHADEFFKQK